MDDRIPPHDDLAERVICSAVLLDADTIDRIGAAALEPEHFYLEPCRQIYAAAIALAGAGQRVDVVAVAGKLRDNGRMPQVGAAYIAELMDLVPSFGNELEYAHRIRDMHGLRELIRVCQTTAAQGYGTIGNVTDFVDAATSRVHAVSALMRDAHEDYAVKFADGFLSITKALEDKTVRPCVSTSIPDLDNDLGGIEAGTVCVLGAPTNWGKTGMVVAIADDALMSGKSVLIVTGEDPPELYLRRLVQRRGRVNAYRLKTRTHTGDDFNKYSKAAVELCINQGTPVILKCAGRPIEHVLHDAERRMKTEHYDLVMFDYLQAFTCKERKESRRTEVNYILRKITDCIKRRGVSGVIVSQIRRLEKGEEPALRDLKESGDIENSAESVLLGFTSKESTPVVRLAKSKDSIKMIDYSLEWDTNSASLRPGHRITCEPM